MIVSLFLHYLRKASLITINIADPCIEFDSTTVFTSNTSDSEVISNFSAHYMIQDGSIQIQVTNYSGPSTGSYYFSPNEDLTYCSANTSGCVLSQETANEDYEYIFMLDVWDPYPQTYHYDAVAGKLIKRNGIFMKEENKPYTPDDKCWNRIEPGNNNSIATSSFCCSRFKKDQNPTLSCPEYQSRSVVYRNSSMTSELYITYTINSDNIHIKMTNYTSSMKSNAQFELFGNNGYSETCITQLYQPKTCLFKYSSDTKYEFEFRTSIYNEGFNMTSITINNLQFQYPPLSPDNLCQTFDNLCELF